MFGGCVPQPDGAIISTGCYQQSIWRKPAITRTKKCYWYKVRTKALCQKVLLHTRTLAVYAAETLDLRLSFFFSYLSPSISHISWMHTSITLQRDKMLRMWCSWIPGTAHPVGVLVERVDEALPVNAPHFHRLVVGRCHQSVTIMGESNTAYSSSVGFEHFRLCFSMVHRHKWFKKTNLYHAYCTTSGCMVAYW